MSYDWDSHDDDLKPTRYPEKSVILKMIDDYIFVEGGFYHYWIHSGVKMKVEDLISNINDTVETDKDNEQIWIETKLSEVCKISLEDLKSHDLVTSCGHIDFKKALV